MIELFDIKGFTKTPIEKLTKLKVGDKIELLTYKKDRKVIIIKKDLNIYDVIEDGFNNNKFEDISLNQLEKLLKKLQRIEFPRSNKYFLKIIPSISIEQLNM